MRECGPGRAELPAVSIGSWTRNWRVNFHGHFGQFILPQKDWRGACKPSQVFRLKNFIPESSPSSEVQSEQLEQASPLKTGHFPSKVWAEMKF